MKRLIERQIEQILRKRERCRCCNKRQAIETLDLYVDYGSRRVAYVSIADGLCRICAGLEVARFIQGCPPADIPDIQGPMVDGDARLERAISWLGCGEEATSGKE